MSQQKVDRHKQEKSGRKEQVAKQKKLKKIGRGLTIIICAAIVALIVVLVVRNQLSEDEEIYDEDGIELSTEDLEDIDYDEDDLEAEDIDVEEADGEETSDGSPKEETETGSEDGESTEEAGQ